MITDRIDTATKISEDYPFATPQRPRVLGLNSRLGHLHKPLPCWSASNEGHTTAEGNLSACCFDATANWTMGDLNKAFFMDVWNSPKFVNSEMPICAMTLQALAVKRCISYLVSRV